MNSTLSETFAAVDLGSNSFHMIVAKYEDGRIQIIDRIKEMIRIASGLDKSNHLSEESMQRGLECLQRFGQRIREVPKANVKVVGTNTLRQARNGKKFIRRSRAALGHNIDIISGQEEARLVFLGVAHTFYNDTEKRLVIDIGGGSTELIIGTGFKPAITDSLYMGCVNTSRQFFADGRISEKRMRAAILYARTELETLAANYQRIGWDSALGSSGTIRTISEVAVAKGWCETGITAESLEKLRNTLITAAHWEKIDLPELSERRRPVFAGGVAVLTAVTQAMNLNALQVSAGALREGIIYELIGRRQNEDIRTATVADMAKRYGVDQEQALKVISTSSELFSQVQKTWQLRQRDRELLLWSAQLLEIGLAIAHAQYHRHGAYLLSNSDMPGFSRQEQEGLAVLVRSHRRKFPLQEFDELMLDDADTLKQLAVLLRLSYVLNRSRSYTAPPQIKLTVKQEELKLEFPKNWLSEHPLTEADLLTEKEYLKATHLSLRFC